MTILPELTEAEELNNQVNALREMVASEQNRLERVRAEYSAFKASTLMKSIEAAEQKIVDMKKDMEWFRLAAKNRNRFRCIIQTLRALQSDLDGQDLEVLP